MNYLQAYYKFRLVPTGNNNSFLVERIFKVGNAAYLNDLFTYDKPIRYLKLQPPGLIEDYIVYSVEYGRNPSDNHMLAFETASYLHPFGNVSIFGTNDCILFRLSDDNTFEVFVSKDNANNVSQLLTMLIDGTLKAEIDNLVNLIP